MLKILFSEKMFCPCKWYSPQWDSNHFSGAKEDGIPGLGWYTHLGWWCLFQWKLALGLVGLSVCCALHGNEVV